MIFIRCLFPKIWDEREAMDYGQDIIVKTVFNNKKLIFGITNPIKLVTFEWIPQNNNITLANKKCFLMSPTHQEKTYDN